MPNGKRISRRRFLSGSSAAGALRGSISVLPRGAEAYDGPRPGSDLGADAIFLTEEEYFSGYGFAFLIFHNHYLGGMQGGLQMILNGERVLDSGDFYAAPKQGSPQVGVRALRRVVDRAAGTATVLGEVAGQGVDYSLICRTDGRRIFVKLRIEDSFDQSSISEEGLRIYIYPKAYFSKACVSDVGGCVFPRQFSGREVLLDGAHHLSVASEDPLAAFAVDRRDGTLRLSDNRRRSPQPWFSIEAPLAPGSAQLEIEIEPRVDPGWRRAPVIAVSQVGYHPDQKKCAVLELDPRDHATEPVRLFSVDFNGSREFVKSGLPKPWGKFLHCQYELFDFSEVKSVGAYFLEYGDSQAGPFRIDPEIYDAAWQSTLEHFLPVQMCHVEVIEGVRSWHGACHLDDARQAPAWTNWTDSYRQGALDTKFAANQHIPGLNWGGWHDAGDYDLPGGSIALTTLALALAQEEFSPDLDETTIDRERARVLLHVPDGRPDLLQQIQYGAESLLSSYRAVGHIFGGVVEVEGYAHLGDPVNITDNLIYDPRLRPGQKVCGRSGTPDDRWAFTNRNTGLQYQTAQTLSAASRVLRKFNDELASECGDAALKLWEYEQNHAPVYWACSYNPRDSGFRCEEILATAELLISTGEARFERRLLDLLPVIESISGEQFGEHWPLPPGWTLSRALDRVVTKNSGVSWLNGHSGGK